MRAVLTATSVPQDTTARLTTEVATATISLSSGRADLTDIFVVEYPEEPRSQILSHLPELKLPERPRQAFLDEVVGFDSVTRQTARKSSKTGKNAPNVAMQYGLSSIDSFIKADGAAGR